MNLSPYELALISGGFTVIGALAGGWIGYKNALSIYNITEFNKAACEFRNAFIVQLNFLKYNVNSGSGDTSNIGEYLRAHYVSNHLKAYETFKCCLSTGEIEAIDKAWEEYCKFNEYSNNKTLARERMEKVLEFAKHK